VFGKHDPRFVGHAPTCATRFAWVQTPEQLTDMRSILLKWAAEQERISADPEWLLEPQSGNWRLTVDTWQHGLTAVAVRNGWERP
jgi:hypothetical protein